MSLLDHAKTELDIIGMTEDSEEMNVAMRHHLLHMIEEFSKEGHSGFSASYAISLLQKLLNYEPLSPLTGEDSEWNDMSEYCDGKILYQNKRCSHVFKEDGVSYDINGKVFLQKQIDENGEEYTYSYTNRDSRVNVEFPYTPKTEYVYV